MPTYRYEISSTNRAACQNSVCKKDGPKIQKGELRFGNLATFQDHDTWKWKHWGCVTPIQIANVQQDIEGLDIDDDSDMMVLDGWEDLLDWARDKIKQALKDGHVADEDWKGDPEKNRPGQKGINSARRKKKTKNEENASEVDDTPVKPKKKRMTKKEKAAAATAEEEAEDELSEREGTPVPAKKKRGKKVKAEEPEDSAEEVLPTKKKRAAPKKRKAGSEDHIKAEDEDPIPEPLKKKARAKKEKVKKEEENDEDVLAGEYAVAEEVPKKKGHTKKVKKEEPDVDEDMSGSVTLPERSAIKKEEDLEEEPDLMDLPNTKAARKSRTKKVKAEAEAEDYQEDVEEPKQTRKPKGKKVKRELGEEPVNDVEDQQDFLKSADPVPRSRGKKSAAKKESRPKEETVSEDELTGLIHNDKAKSTEEIEEKPKPKKDKKVAKRKAR